VSAVYLQQFSNYSNHNCKKRHFYIPRPSFFVCAVDAPVAITLNVVWMEREFDAYICLAACVHLTITFSEIERDIGRKSSFFIPPCFRRVVSATAWLIDAKLMLNTTDQKRLNCIRLAYSCRDTVSNKIHMACLSSVDRRLYHYSRRSTALSENRWPVVVRRCSWRSMALRRRVRVQIN